MNRGTLILSLVVACLIGCAIGFISSVMMARAAFGVMPPMPFFGHHGSAASGGAGGSESHRDRFERLSRALDLTPEQVANLKPRVDATRKKFDALRDSMRVEIDRELTPEQRVKWKKLQAMRQFPRPGHDRGAWPPPTPADSGADKEHR